MTTRKPILELAVQRPRPPRSRHPCLSRGTSIHGRKKIGGRSAAAEFPAQGFVPGAFRGGTPARHPIERLPREKEDKPVRGSMEGTRRRVGESITLRRAVRTPARLPRQNLSLHYSGLAANCEAVSRPRLVPLPRNAS